MSQIIRDITEIARCGAQYRTDALTSIGKDKENIHNRNLIRA